MRSNGSLADDDRAIEGLPIRLVIAIVVGVATLGIMTTMLGDVGSITSTEVTVELAEDDVTLSAGESHGVGVTVVGEDGDRVEGATVVVSAGSARIDEPVEARTGSDGTATLDGVAPALRQGQETGTLELDVVPPGDSDFVDDRENPEIVVIEG